MTNEEIKEALENIEKSEWQLDEIISEEDIVQCLKQLVDVQEENCELRSRLTKIGEMMITPEKDLQTWLVKIVSLIEG